MSYFHTVCKRPCQCGNMRILLQLKFYVKSITWIVEVQNLPLEKNFDFYVFLQFLQAEIDQVDKIQTSKYSKNCSFRISITFSKIDFT